MCCVSFNLHTSICTCTDYKTRMFSIVVALDEASGIGKGHVLRVQLLINLEQAKMVGYRSGKFQKICNILSSLQHRLQIP
jgi:hypothetical protein